MSVATHNPNVTVAVSLDAARASTASFSSVLLLVGRNDNSLDGDRVMSLASYEEGQDAEDAGFISSTTLEAVRVAFNQDHVLPALKLGSYDDRTPTKAFKDFGDVGGGNFDTVIEAHTAGVDGNEITVALVADGSGSVSITRSGNAVTIHFIAATSTVTNVQTAIAALSGADDIIDVKTAGTGATVLASGDAFAATSLASGVGAEAFADALQACIDADPDFYGVALDSRDLGDIEDVSAAMGATVAAGSRIFIYASNDADWLTGTAPSEADDIALRERTAGVYQADTSKWHDVAWLVDRLSFDPDVQSVPWHACPLREVGDYSASITATQRANAIANNINIVLPQGDETAVVDAGVNAKGRALDEIVTADWFSTRLSEGVNRLVVKLSSRGTKLPVTPGGQSMIKAIIDNLITTGINAGHFDPDVSQHSVTAEGITDADRDARRFRFTIRLKLAVSGRIFTFTVIASRQSQV